MRDKELIDRAFEALGEDAPMEEVDDWVRLKKQSIAEKRRFSWASVSSRRLSLYNWFAAAPTVLGILSVQTMAVLWAANGQLNDRAFVAMFVGLPMLLMMVYGIGRKIFAGTKYNLRLGSDGFELGEEFLPWSEVAGVESVDGAVNIKKVDGEALSLSGAPAELLLAVSERLARYGAHPLPPVLPPSALENGEGYRESPRGLLVRVAANPKAPSSDRIAAAQALEAMGVEDARVSEAFLESANSDLRRKAVP